MRAWLVLALVLSTTPALGDPVSGTVTYREPVALPPESVVTVQLVDAARQDAPAVVLAETRRLTLGGPPYAFSLEVDPLLLGERRRQLRLVATVEVGGVTSMRTDVVHPLTPQSFEAPVELVVGIIAVPPASKGSLRCAGEGWSLEIDDDIATLNIASTPVPVVQRFSGRLVQPGDDLMLWFGGTALGPTWVAIARSEGCVGDGWSLDLVDGAGHHRSGCCPAGG